MMLVQEQKSDRVSFRWLAKLLVAIWDRRNPWRRRWRKVLFRIEATGRLANFHCGNGVRLDVPVRIGGGSGTLGIGNDVWLGWNAAPMLGKGTILLQPRSSKSVITIGAGTIMSNNVSMVAMGKISIGKHCLVGDLTQIFDCDFHELAPSNRCAGVGPIEPVSIGDNVWIGSHVLILRGVTIGNNSVIGAGSIVTRSIPQNSLAVGVPAKVVRML